MGFFFDRKITIRLRADEEKQIEIICNLLDERYDNQSHFIRCAVLKLIREEAENVRKINEHSKNKRN